MTEPPSHFLTRAAILPWVKQWKTEGFKIIFTSGTFDLLHWGHASYLEQANRVASPAKFIVAVNSDFSVQNYKDPSRPIQKELDRLRMVTKLEMVDAAFIFNETNNQENILELKPDFYVKAGDYSVEKLTSAKYLAEWGGKAMIIPFEDGYSTTEIINRIIKINQQPQSEPKKMGRKKPAVFLDRDGVINREVEYLHQAEDFVLLPKVIEGLKKMSALGYRLIIVTTQAGIGLGYFSEADFFKVNKKMLSLFSKEGIVIDKIYFCPHSKSDDCDCRKPRTRLLERAKKEAHIDLERSIFIGDKTSDIKTGERLGLTTILMETGHAGQDGEFKVTPHYQANDLLAAAHYIESRQS